MEIYIRKQVLLDINIGFGFRRGTEWCFERTHKSVGLRIPVFFAGISFFLCSFTKLF